MATILHDWTPEKVLLLAPNAATAREAQRIAASDDWVSIGYDRFGIWGMLEQTKPPLQIKVDFFKLMRSDPKINRRASGCTCSGNVRPCAHALALLFMLLDDEAELIEEAPPPYYTDWLDKAALRARAAYKRTYDNPDILRVPDTFQQTLATRKETVATGIEELEQWLINLIRHGLVDPRVKDYSFWDSIADRMVDAQVPGLAHWLRDLAGYPSRQDEWAEPLLEQLGRMYLLVESFKRFDDLPLEAQADLRMVLGWYLKPHEVDLRTRCRDAWFVLANVEQDVSDHLRVQRIWLRSETRGDFAMLRDFALGDNLLRQNLKPGSIIDAELAYFPSRYPLQALLLRQFGEPQTGHLLDGASIERNIHAYSAALAQNPWLEHFPMILHNVYPVKHDERWVVRDAPGNYLPLGEDFNLHWPLMALSGGHPITVMGEWNGSALMPHGVLAEGRFVDLDRVGQL